MTFHKVQTFLKMNFINLRDQTIVNHNFISLSLIAKQRLSDLPISPPYLLNCFEKING